MADNDDINKSPKKSLNEIGRLLKSFQKELEFVPAGEVSILEKIRQKNKEADALYDKINILQAQIKSADRRVADATAKMNALSAQYNATTDPQIRSQIMRDARSYTDEIKASRIIAQSAREQLDPLEQERNKLLEDANQKSETVATRSAIRQESKQRHFVNQVSDLFSESSFGGAVLRQRRAPESVQGAQKLIARGRTFNELHAERQKIQQEIQALQEEAVTLGGSAFDLNNEPTEASDRLKYIYFKNKALSKHAASIELAMDMRSARGEDPLSREARISKTSAWIEEYSRQKGLASEIQSGKIELNEAGGSRKVSVDLSDVESRLEKEIDGFNRIFAEGRAAAAKGEKNLEAFNEELYGATERIEKLKDVIGATRGEEQNKKIGTIQNIMQTGFALQSVGGAIGQVFVGQTNTITNTKIAAAQQANDLFFRRQAALSGDMTQLTALSQTVTQSNDFTRDKLQFTAAEKAEKEASKSEVITNVSGAFDAAGEVLEAGGAIAGAVIERGASGGTGAVGSVGRAVGATARAGTSVIGLLRNVNGNAEGRAEYSRQMQLSDEEIKIRGFQRQQFYNYSMGVTEAALTGGGEAGQRFFQQMLGGQNEYGPIRSSDQMLERMRAAGISTDQMAQMGQMGLAQQGSVFNADQVFSAKALQDKGYGTVESNMRMYGQLAGAGANNPSASFEKVLEVAVAKGFDSSKATSMLVENTAAMSQRSIGAALGIDVSGGALASIAGIAAGKEEQPNREFALGRAATAAQAYEAISSNTGISMTTMATATQIQRAAGVDRETAQLLLGMDRATVQNFYSQAQEYEKMSPNDKTTFKDKLDKAGLFEFIDEKTGEVRIKALQTGLNIKNQGNLANRLLLTGKIGSQEMSMFEQFIGGGYQELQKTKKGKAFTSKMNKLVPLITSSTGTSITGFEASMGGSLKDIDTEEAKKKLAQKPEASFLDMLRGKDAPAREQATQTQLGAQEMGGITEAINRIAEATQVISKMGMDGKSGNFSELASKAASEFNSGAEFFKTGMVYFDKALDKLSVKVDMPKPERPLDRKL
jgi:predicted  nucleic acid-binding Zn-ribbon protein